MEIIISPSILSADFGILAKQIKDAENAGAKYLHIDVMDGMFVKNISFGLPVIKSLRKYTDMVFDVHLMIVKPERYIDQFVKAGADIITIHAESTENIGTCIELIKQHGAKAGLALSPGTGAEAALPYLDRLDMVLCMTVEPGLGGQSYIDSVNEKIRTIRDASGDRFNIQVDGGVSAKNINIPVSYGANIIVAGTSVFSGDIKTNIKELLECAR